MIPARFDFPCHRNADYTETLSFKDGSQPVDLSGMIPSLQVRLYATAPNVLFSVPVTIDDPVSGEVNITIDRQLLEQTYNRINANVVASQTIFLVYDMRFTYDTGRSEVWLQGLLSIEPGVTF
jgi:hypothetical protein